MAECAHRMARRPSGIGAQPSGHASRGDGCAGAAPGRRARMARKHRDRPRRLMRAYTYGRAMRDAARLSRAIRAGRVAVYRSELDGVLALAGETWPHSELLGTGLCALYDWDADEWLVDESWLSPRQRRVLHEAVGRRARGG